MKKIIFPLLVCFAVLLNSCEKKKKDFNIQNPFLFREYVSYTDYKPRSTADPIVIELAKEVDKFNHKDEIPAGIFEIEPAVKGKLSLENYNRLKFTPDKKLKPATEYKVKLHLDKLYHNVPNELKEFSFDFQTLTPNFIVRTESLQSYSRDWQFVRGTLESADIIEKENLPKLVKAYQNNKALSIKWEETEKPARYFKFIIDSIHREAEESKITLQWDGKAIQADAKGENDLMIPGYMNFQVVDIQTETAPKASLRINFSDPLDPDQDFAGLVKIEKLPRLKYQVDGNVLYVYPDQRINGELNISIYPGIKNTDAYALKEVFTDKISFEQLKPQVELISKGVILPQAKSTPLYFKTVNLKAVDVRIVQIYENNILEFLQSNKLNDADEYNIRRMGKRIAKETIHLDVSESEKDNWKAHALKLSDIFKMSPGAIYQVELSFKPAYSTYECEDAGWADNFEDSEEEIREQKYWNNETYSWRKYIYDWKNRENPCYPVYYQPDNFVRTNLLASDLGLIVKKSSDNSYRIFATNLLQAQPEAGVSVRLYNYQKQLIHQATTDAEGEITYDGDENIAFVIGKKSENYAYADVQNSAALSLSKFDISGTQLEKGLKGFIYTERGVHRPGDTIHLTFVLNDKENPLPKEVPVKLEVENARGKLVQRELAFEGQADQVNALNRFYHFAIPTEQNDETGNWFARISAGGAVFSKSLNVANVKPNRLKIKLDFDQEILTGDKPVSGLLTGTWLQGAPARNLKAEMQVTITEAHQAFKGFENYTFSDPVRKFYQSEIQFLKEQLSAEGTYRFNKPIKLNTKAPGMLKATFLTQLFEGGGDFSLDVFSKNLAPYTHFIGLRSPKSDDYGSLNTNENNRFELVSLTPSGEIAPNRKIKIRVYQIEWRWWWSRQDDRLSQYEDGAVHKAFQSFEVTTNAQGKAEINLNIPDKDRGRYLIRAIDEASGHATGKVVYFYKNWYDDPGMQDADNTKMLVFNSDKKEYRVGETAKITFPSGEGGHALFSIESGTKVLSTKWIRTQKGNTEVEIPLTTEMAPNVYVHISLLQEHERVKNDLPIRLYGVIPIKVENPESILKPQIEMPNELKPLEKYSIKISEENKKAMTYTVAVVEEGLLDLTRFATPDIHGRFYSREALGVKTFDLYDDVIGAYSGTVNNIYEIGGDDAAESGKKNKANRFKPVVKYLGPFYLKAGEARTHELEMPNYIGSVRVMVVAGDTKKAAFGNAEKTSPVKKPLMVLASVPRKLSPGETLELPVTVFSMDSKIENVKVEVSTSEAFEALDGKTKTIQFDKPDEKIINFNYKIKPTQKVQNIVVNVSGHGETASYEVEIDVENPNPPAHKITDYKIDKNAQKEIVYQDFGEEGERLVKLELSTLPPMNFTKHLQYLENYPHLCIEQSTSTAFPFLFLDEITDLSSQDKNKYKRNIESVIKKLGDAQLTNGSLPFWPGQRNTNEWVTSYAGHFMLEAKEKGYALPISFLNNWIRYQQTRARQWNIHDYSYNSSLTQAYRLYSLALAGHPELAAMNRLRESGNMSNEAKWRLAAAYAIAGKKEVAREIAASANIHFSSGAYDYYNYGSPLRNKAMALETMVILGDDQQRELSLSLAREMMERSWLNTQESSYSLLAMAKMIRKSGGKEMDLTILQDGKSQTVKTSHALAEIDLDASGKNSIRVTNHKDNLVYASLYQEGQPALGEEKADRKNLSISTSFVDGEGKAIDIRKVRQGTELEAHITISNISPDYIHVVALTQAFPSGWEIVNTSFTELEGGVTGEADYTDIRDDRVHFYFDLKKGETKTFTVKLNASYLGKYYLPGSFAEGMYDRNYYVQQEGRWVEVHL